MAQAIRSALPDRLMPSNGDEEFAKRHHGKTRSHMVSTLLSLCHHSSNKMTVQEELTHHQAFENTSTSIAAAQMRNALTKLAETVKDPDQKKLFETEMDNFFSLFRRYLNDKAKGNEVYVS